MRLEEVDGEVLGSVWLMGAGPVGEEVVIFGDGWCVEDG